MKVPHYMGDLKRDPNLENYPNDDALHRSRTLNPCALVPVCSKPILPEIPKPY